VQGPPGTGKSSTIVGLVSALLSGKAPLPQQRQSGCLIHPGKTMGLTFAEPQARNRILICAATNQAVDSLAWKIKQGSRKCSTLYSASLYSDVKSAYSSHTRCSIATVGPSGKVGDFALARFGSLPWENSRNLTDQKPEILSSMEDFLYEINVDRRAGDGMQDFEYYEEEQEQAMSWSPEKMKPQRKKRRKIVGRAKVRSQVLASCSVVITTLSGAGSKAFVDAVCRDPTRNDSEFDAVIIDEACQASEPESLIPFKFNPTTITLVGKKLLRFAIYSAVFFEK
jgi:senataxin